MLRIVEPDTRKNYRILHRDDRLFHQALAFVKKGEKRFHVRNDAGPDFDIVYFRNQDWARSQKGYDVSSFFDEFDLYPPYEDYDENDAERLCLDMFDDFDTVYFEEASEYSIVLTGIILKYTDKVVAFGDDRIRWFFETGERLKIVSEPAGGKTLLVTRDYYPCGISQDYSRMDAILVFHQVFLFQWMTDRPLRDIRYAEITVPRSEGFGSILITYALACDFFEKHGIRAVLKAGSSRYSDAILSRYLDVSFLPEDADENNTLSVVNFFSFHFVYSMRGRYCPRVRKLISAGFLAEIKEYGNAVFDGKKVLGLLVRGSDYITTGMSGEMKPPVLEDVIRMVRSRMDTGRYDCIFLATEDRDILARMRDEFGSKILAVSQERYSVRELRESMTISEYDSQKYKGEDYERYLDDMTANYLYAVILLSRCDSFIYSCRCVGSSLVRQLATRPFHEVLCVTKGKEA